MLRLTVANVAGCEKGMVIDMKYKDEGMDCKKLVLLFLQKFWIAALAAVIGAVLGGSIYLLLHVVINSNREYQAESKVYLDFAPDESGEIYQEYNGYTWNDLMSTKLILDRTMSYLPDTYTEEEVTSATSAQILSDLRLLTITITTSDADKTAEILKATDLSLVEMGKQEKEFITIEVIKETEPKMVVADPRLLQAVLVGLVIALVAVLLVMALHYVLNDRIYVPGDLKCVTELPFVGFCFTEGKVSVKSKTDREQELLRKLQQDLEKNQSYLAEKLGTLTILDLDKDNPVTEQIDSELRETDGIFLMVSYGKMDRASLAYRIEQLTLQECRLAGIMIKDADMRFMKWYYNHL